MDEAICYVPRTHSLRTEYRRKVRTMTRGMETLMEMRELLDPWRYPRFAWMLWSHKLCRWLLPWALLVSLFALGVLAGDFAFARWLLLLTAVGAALAGTAFVVPESRRIPSFLTTPAYLFSGNLAALHSTIRAAHGDRNALWEPTRRHPASV